MCDRRRDDHLAARSGRESARPDARRIERPGRGDSTIQFSRNRRLPRAHSRSAFRRPADAIGDCRNHGRDARGRDFAHRLARARLARPAINTAQSRLALGSHEFDQYARVGSSVTSMTGKLIHTAQTQTILAGSVPQTRPDVIDRAWLEAGMREQRRSGLARALFCVRLLEQGSDGSPEQRLSFLIGAFLARIWMRWFLAGCSIRRRGSYHRRRRARRSRGALAHSSVRAVIFGDADVERALLAGCRSVFSALGAVPRA